MKTAYNSPADLAREIGSVWSSRGRLAYTWPYNRFQWETSESWWLVPAPDRLAFRYAKIVVTSASRVAGPGLLFTGLYVEKGLGPALVSARYYPDDWFIGPTWRWHGVLRDLAGGQFKSAVALASRQLGEPVDIRVDAHVPIAGPARLRPSHDLLAFECEDGDRLRPAMTTLPSAQHQFLGDAKGAVTLGQLAESLQAIPNGDTAWVNLYIGRAFEKSGLADVAALDAVQLVNRLLEPLAPWIA